MFNRARGHGIEKGYTEYLNEESDLRTQRPTGGRLKITYFTLADIRKQIVYPILIITL